MNKYFTYILFPVSLALLAIGFSACQEDDELPSITSEGKNTFGCLVNGELWLPKGSFNVPRTSADYSSGYFLTFNAGNESSEFSFFIRNPIVTNKVYPIQDTSLVKVNYYDGLNHDVVCIYNEYNVLNGNLTFTKFDLSNYILSGTFEFTSYSSNCSDTVKVTNGRFDIGDITY